MTYGKVSNLRHDKKRLPTSWLRPNLRQSKSQLFSATNKDHKYRVLQRNVLRGGKSSTPR